jgi:Lrp/AsnC family transcriptional regulator for asnA, asnC and gidA
MDFEIDELDRKILERLRGDSRKPFLEIARELKVSGGTIHARVNRMKSHGIIKGSRIHIDYEKLGYSITAFIGIKLAKARGFKQIQTQLKAFPQIVEVHYTTGLYSLLIKVMVSSMKDLHILLSEELQSLEEIQSTETFVILNTYLDRELRLQA